MREENSLAENARLFAELNVALADAAIVAWDAKYIRGTPIVSLYGIMGGWNHRLARLSSHPKSKIMGWGFPPA